MGYTCLCTLRYLYLYLTLLHATVPRLVVYSTLEGEVVTCTSATLYDQISTKADGATHPCVNQPARSSLSTSKSGSS